MLRSINIKNNNFNANMYYMLKKSDTVNFMFYVDKLFITRSNRSLIT